MGLKNLKAITEALIRHGRDSSTPAAVVQEGSTEAQRSLRSTLGAVAVDVTAAKIRPPAIVVIGEVAAIGA